MKKHVHKEHDDYLNIDRGLLAPPWWRSQVNTRFLIHFISPTSEADFWYTTKD